MVMLISLTFAALPAGYALAQVAGMDDDCCAQQVSTRLGAVTGVSAAAADPKTGQACLSLASSVEPANIQKALEGSEYSLTSVTPVAACPEGLAPKKKDAWAGVSGLDVTIVSHGETVDLVAHAAPGKFTVYDFGAPWCAPCYTTADRLKAYMATSPDVAVRAVVLDAGDPKQSFALPVVKQYLQFAEGLPWLRVVDAKGAKVYEGADVEAAITAIGKKRGK